MNISTPAKTIDFIEAVYRAWNLDVDAAIQAGSLESGQVHFEEFGRHESRPPYCHPARPCGTPPVRAGDRLVQPVMPGEDYWAGAAFYIATHGALCRVVADCTVVLAATGQPVRAWRYDEWADDNERLVFKFEAIERSRGLPYLFCLTVVEVTAAQPVQLPCVSAADCDGLVWNEMPPATVRIDFEFLYTPPRLPGPAGITLNPLTQCRGTCRHCLGRMHQRKPGALKPQWIEALRAHYREGPGVAWCTDYATDYFYAARRRPELIDLLAANGAVSINTEGQHVTAEPLRRLMAGGLIKLGFSCDAATEETYAWIRPGLGKLQTVLASARLAVQLRREMGLGRRPRIALLMVAMKSNVREMTALVELAAQNGVDGVWVNQLWVCTPDMVEESLMFAPELWRGEAGRARQRAGELGVDFCLGPDLRPDHPQRGVTWCPEPWSAMIVLGNGDVLACASPVSRIASLHDSTIGEIWNSAIFQELRRRVNTDRAPLMCDHCFAYRKPGNGDGVFVHHLVDGYDLTRDLTDPNYADAFRRRFSFDAARAGRAMR